MRLPGAKPVPASRKNEAGLIGNALSGKYRASSMASGR
jgi:hypothetical protein